MFKTKAKTKFLDVSRSIKLLYILIGGIVLTIVAFFLYQNFLVAFTLLACLVALLGLPELDSGSKKLTFKLGLVRIPLGFAHLPLTKGELTPSTK
jgi:hypothetical protein